MPWTRAVFKLIAVVENTLSNTGTRSSPMPLFRERRRSEAPGKGKRLRCTVYSQPSVWFIVHPDDFKEVGYSKKF